MTVLAKASSSLRNPTCPYQNTSIRNRIHIQYLKHRHGNNKHLDVPEKNNDNNILFLHNNNNNSVA
jgi:hypothetical protein